MHLSKVIINGNYFATYVVYENKKSNKFIENRVKA